MEEGVVYPGDVEVAVELTDRPTICPDVTAADTSCTVNLPRDIYNISITQSNDIGSTVDSARFDSELVCFITHMTPMVCSIVAVLVVEEKVSLILNTQLLLIVTVSRNKLCPETESPVLVTFGARAVAGGECKGQQNATQVVIASGKSVSFYVDADTISLGTDETVCFIVSLDGVPGRLQE